MILLFFSLLSSTYARADWLEDVAACKASLTGKLESPLDDKKTINKNCKNSAGSEIDSTFSEKMGDQKIKGACVYTYVYTQHQYVAIQRSAEQVCADIAKAKASTAGLDPFQATQVITNAARQGLANYRATFEVASEAMGKLRARNIEFSRKEIDKIKTDPSNELITKAAEKNYNSTKSIPQIDSNNERDKLNNPLLAKSDVSARASEQMAAANEALRFKTQMDAQKEDFNKLDATLAENINTARQRQGDQKSLTQAPEAGIGSTISGILPYAPLAISLGTMLMNKNASSSNGGNVPGSNPPPPAPAQLKSASLAEGKSEKPAILPGAPINEPASPKGTTGIFGAAPENPAPAGSSVQEKELSWFNGELGAGSVFSTASAGKPSGKGGSDSASVENAGIVESATPPAAPEDPHLITSTAGTSRSPSSADSRDSPKDSEIPALPKLTDDSHPTAADGLGKDLLDYMEKEPGKVSNTEFSSEAVPGGRDARSLFARVRDRHTVCLKKGCVTSEAGGKVL